MRLGRLVASAALAGCSTPPAPATELPPPPPVQPAPPPCRDPPTGGEIVAQWNGPRCPYVLTRRGDRLRLDSRDLAQTPAAEGLAPTCRAAACRYEGVDTELGPLVIVVEPGAQSEVPLGVQLGIVHGGTRLDFVDLWAAAGPSVTEDATDLGPAHALVPMRCAGQLALVAASRLSAGDGVPPPPTLVARGGRVVRDAVALQLVPVDATGCQPLHLPLP